MIKGYAEKGDLFVRIPRPDTVVVSRKLRSDTVNIGAEVVVFINKKDFSGKHNTLDARGQAICNLLLLVKIPPQLQSVSLALRH